MDIHDYLAAQRKIVKMEKMRNWIAENWVSLFTLIFSAVSAIAAIVSAVAAVLVLIG